MSEEPIEVGIVPHTHWDREWYEPFQTSRLRLVRLLDDLLPLLERDPSSYARFLLDGQTAVLDDYLAIRPDAEATLRRLGEAGRLQVGPWMILMDEFMVSGETLVRDLQLGLTRGAAFGGAMPIGYLPDMFGHVAQMPQLLRLVGFEHAVVWRGVPASVQQTAFRWEAPDGSQVRAEYLYGSYSNGRDLPDVAEQLVARARDYERELGSARLPGGGMLLMNGTDHQMPQPWVSRLVEEANARQGRYRFAITSLAEYLDHQPTDGLATVKGELRSGARANVLMGVASNRVDVHQLAAGAERALERRAEPLAALFTPTGRYPHPFLLEAWRLLVLNSAHDSSCACSHDDVVDAVRVRYQEAGHLADVIAREALTALVTTIDAPPDATIVANPTPADRSGLVELPVPGSGPVHFLAPDGIPVAAQVLDVDEGEGFAAMPAPGDITWVLDMIRGPELAGRPIAGVERTDRADGVHEVVFRAARGGETAVDLTGLREEVAELAAAGRSLRVRLVRAPVRRVLLHARDVPGFGWSSYSPVEGEGPPGPVTATEGALANEHLRVAVDPGDGTCAIRTTEGIELRGALRLVEGGDGGDTYNYSPPIEDRIVEIPDAVRVSALEAGPLRARLVVERDYRWPAFALGDERACPARSETEVPVTVHTFLELRAGERFLRVHVELDNVVRDHRLRVHVPIPARVEGSDAECAFAVVRRRLEAEGGPHERALPTFVSRRFVDASGRGALGGTVGVALLHDGLLEYEVVEAAERGADLHHQELALTLLRATGYLSRAEAAYRPNPAGPLDPLEGPQLIGARAADFAVLPHMGNWLAADLHSAADAFLVPLDRARRGELGERRRPTRGHELRVSGARVSAVLRDADDRLVVRLSNATPAVATATVERAGTPARGSVVDLRGRELATFEGSVSLRQWEIATLRLETAT